MHYMRIIGRVLREKRAFNVIEVTHTDIHAHIHTYAVHSDKNDMTLCLGESLGGFATK